MASGEWVDPQRAGAWISDVARLRTRTRRIRRGTWFPLTLFGLVVLAATPVFWPAAVPESRYRSFPVGGFLGGLGTPNPSAVAIYWMIALPATYAATVGFYVWRAHRTGVATPITGYVETGVGLFVLLVLITLPAFAFRSAGWTPWLLTLAVSVGLLGYAWAKHSPPVAIAAVALLLPGLPLGNLAIRGLLPLTTIALGLFALAWLERSVGLLVFTVLFLGLTITANLYNLENLLFRLGVDFSDYRIGGMVNLWVSGAMLLLGGAFFGLVRAREARRP